jgi:probable phosphoglycerate mutase
MIDQLILIRHGETVLNAAGIAQGWNDSALSETGLRQVERLAARIAPRGIDAIFSSPLGRAYATAAVIAREAKLPIVKLDELREMCYGKWEGMRFLDVREQYAGEYAKWIADPDFACPDGESHNDLLRRMESAFAKVHELANGAKRVVIVTHGTAIRVGATSLLSATMETARHLAQDNASLNIFVRRGERFVLKLWNDTTHCE